MITGTLLTFWLVVAIVLTYDTIEAEPEKAARIVLVFALFLFWPVVLVAGIVREVSDTWL